MNTGKVATDTRVRVALEVSLLDRLAQHVRVALKGMRYASPKPGALRRQLLGRAARFTETIDPAAASAANAIRDAFGRVAILYDDGAYRRTQRAASLRQRSWRVVYVDGMDWFFDRADQTGDVMAA